MDHGMVKDMVLGMAPGTDHGMDMGQGTEPDMDPGIDQDTVPATQDQDTDPDFDI